MKVFSCSKICPDLRKRDLIISEDSVSQIEQNSGHQMNVLMLVRADYFIEKFLFFKKLK